MVKKLTIFLLLFIAAAVAIYLYVYQDHRDVAATDASATFTSDSLQAVFTDSDPANDVKTLNAVILVKGTVTSTADSTIVLDHKIYVQLQKKTTFRENQEVTVKGRCLGYDDLLEEVKIDQAIPQ